VKNDAAGGILQQRSEGKTMKWLWIAFALVWALSILLDGRRRAGALRVPRAAAEPKSSSDEALPALLTSRETR
jgi:hypothetical protein